MLPPGRHPWPRVPVTVGIFLMMTRHISAGNGQTGRRAAHRRRRQPWQDARVRSTLISNIGELVTNAPPDGAAGQFAAGQFAALSNAALVIESGQVAWTGSAADAPAADEVVDAGGRAVLPGFVDSHAHLVFAGERSAEFAARMAGLPYSAGGIRSTVAATRAASDQQLRANLARLT